MPAFYLDPVAGVFPTAALILAARSSGDQSAVLLHFVQPERFDYGRFVAAGDLLAARRNPGFAKILMTWISVDVETLVVRRGEAPGGIGRGYSIGCGFGVLPVPRKDWPEIGVFSLSDAASDGTVPLVAGRHPVFFKRIVNRSYVDGSFVPAQSGGQDLDIRVREYLADYLDIDPARFPLPPHVSVTLYYTSDAAYVREAQSIFDRLRAIYRAMELALSQKSYLSATEAAGLELKLTHTVLDLRQGNPDPLPSTQNF